MRFVSAFKVVCLHEILHYAGAQLKNFDFWETVPRGLATTTFEKQRHSFLYAVLFTYKLLHDKISRQI